MISFPMQHVSDNVPVDGPKSYGLTLSFDPCQITEALRYEFSRLHDGTPHRRAAYGRKAGCFCFDKNGTMEVIVLAFCSKAASEAELPGIRDLELKLTLHNEEKTITFSKKVTKGPFYKMFSAETPYRFSDKDCNWPLKGKLSALVNFGGEGLWVDKKYEFDPEVIVGRGGP